MEIVEIKKPIKEQKDFAKLIEKGDYYAELDDAILHSPTASMALLMFKRYCLLPDLKPLYAPYWGRLVDERFRYGHFTLWIEYDTNLEVKGAHYRMSRFYRAKEHDDLGNTSMYLNVRTGKKFPAFNPDKKVVQAQIEKAGGFKKFNGQIYQFNSTSAPYEYSPLVPVFDWMKVEADTPDYITAASDNSLFGNNIFIMKKAAESFTDPNAPEAAERKLSNTDKVVGALRNSKTVKNSGTNHVIQVQTEEPLDDIFKKVEIGNNIDIDKFNAVDEKAGKKICTASYCFPQILANPSEGLFGNSGEAYQAAISFWAATCLNKAEEIEQAFRDIGLEIQNTPEPVEPQNV